MMTTDRIVYGSAVVDDQPTPSGMLNPRSGQVVLWHQTRTLTLADGTTAYGCAHCDEYVSRNRNSIRPHLSKHNRRDHGNPGDISVKQLVRQLGSVQDITSDRDRWKARALKAEKALRVLRDALVVGDG